MAIIPPACAPGYTPHNKHMHHTPKIATDASASAWAYAAIAAYREPCASLAVEPLHSEAALHKYHAPLVICSWMHPGLDLTSTWRKHGVLEYVLLGEALTGTCGKPWETYGVDLNQQVRHRHAWQSMDTCDVMIWMRNRMTCTSMVCMPYMVCDARVCTDEWHTPSQHTATPLRTRWIYQTHRG